ncbi:HAD family hydrolase [Akkermansiaceae bacterium]|nr:HAD family hydrolase [Akkermansiaceae bacterium]MDB4437451.1 HAD family hydrolase [bacterium]MDB4332710.1 HAD family hydrolase [Akkermansiaceae bacterium]MDB4525729.1 HAD family hydrolase [Akkermansiaceae bacterium]MDB4546968.1 HAD family hydrolase [Akkermansiaceae bacterium]
MYQNLLFDWSGTLVNDLPPTLFATNAVLRKHNVPEMDLEEFRKRFRLPYPEFYDEVLPGVAIDSLEGIFRSSFSNSPVQVTVLPHAREMMEWCTAQKIRCFVLSSMDSSIFAHQSRELKMDHFFEEIYSGVIDKRDRIGEILTTHGLALENTAFVGDMVHDIETAHHGEIASVAVTTGYDPEARLRKAEPKHLFHDLTAFREWLEGNPSQT